MDQTVRVTQQSLNPKPKKIGSGSPLPRNIGSEQLSSNLALGGARHAQVVRAKHHHPTRGFGIARVKASCKPTEPM